MLLTKKDHYSNSAIQPDKSQTHKPQT